MQEATSISACAKYSTTYRGQNNKAYAAVYGLELQTTKFFKMLLKYLSHNEIQPNKYGYYNLFSNKLY